MLLVEQLLEEGTHTFPDLTTKVFQDLISDIRTAIAEGYDSLSVEKNSDRMDAKLKELLEASGFTFDDSGRDNPDAGFRFVISWRGQDR